MVLEAQTARDFFDTQELQDVRLYINRADWQKLRQNYLENTYYQCDFQWRDVVVEGIGIRSRGLGSRNANKPGLRVDFDRYEEGLEFLGLKSFVLDNLVQDPSLLKERLSMAMFRRVGMAAVRETHARLYVNDEYAGLYLIVESIDKEFLDRHLGEKNGYLYEYKWNEEYRFEYRGPEPELYSPNPFKPQTNENNPQPAPLEAMIRTMNQASDEQFPDAIREFLDMNLFLKHVAVEMFLAELDGILGDFGLNNFYIYRFNHKNLFQVFPWDKDVTFSAIDRSIWRNADTNVLMRRAMKVPEFHAIYLDKLLDCADFAGGRGGWLAGEIERMYGQIRQAALEDNRKPLGNEVFENTVEYLRQFARERPDLVRAEVSASAQ